jgi:hypothetical protein
VVIAVIVTAPLFNLETGASPEALFPGLPTGYLTLPFYASLSWLWTLTEIRNLLAIALGVAAIVVRYRRGSDSTRRQLLWLMLAAMLALGATIPWGLAAGTPIVVLFTIPLIPRRSALSSSADWSRSLSSRLAAASAVKAIPVNVGPSPVVQVSTYPASLLGLGGDDLQSLGQRHHRLEMSPQRRSRDENPHGPKYSVRRAPA